MLSLAYAGSCNRSKPAPTPIRVIRVGCLPPIEPLPPIDAGGLIPAGEPGCDVDPAIVAACITPAHAIQLERLIEVLVAFRRQALQLCTEGSDE